MKKMFPILILMFVFVGCSAVGNPAEKVVFISPGESRSFSITVNSKNSTDSTYIWKYDNTTLAGIIGKSCEIKTKPEDKGSHTLDVYQSSTNTILYSWQIFIVTTWAKTIGSTGEESAIWIDETSDGEYLLAGSRRLIGQNHDVITMKINSHGDIRWQKNLSGNGDNVPKAAVEMGSINLTPDFVIVGSTDSTWISQFPQSTNHGLTDAFILHAQEGVFDSLLLFGGSNDDEANAVVRSYHYNNNEPDQPAATIAGATSSNLKGTTGYGGKDFLIADLAEPNGWVKKYGGSGEDTAHAISKTSDGGYIVVGVSYSKSIKIGNLPELLPSLPNNPSDHNCGNGDFYIIKTDAYGGIIWHRLYGGNGTDNALSVIETHDHNYVVAGYTNSTNLGTPYGGYDFLLLKLDKDGNVIKYFAPKSRTTQPAVIIYGGEKDDANCHIIEVYNPDYSGDDAWQYIVAGYSDSAHLQEDPGCDYNNACDGHGGKDIYLVRFYSDLGYMAGARIYGGKGDDVPNCIQLLNDGGILIAGTTNSTDLPWAKNKGGNDMLVMKLDRELDLVPR